MTVTKNLPKVANQLIDVNGDKIDQEELINRYLGSQAEVKRLKKLFSDYQSNSHLVAA